MSTWIWIVIAVVVVLGAGVLLLMRGGGGGIPGVRFPPGTRAFESEMSLKILVQMIEAREIELRGPIDDAKREDLETQLANMRKQSALHQAVVDAGDTSPGKGSFGVNPDADHI